MVSVENLSSTVDWGDLVTLVEIRICVTSVVSGAEVVGGGIVAEVFSLVVSSTCRVVVADTDVKSGYKSLVVSKKQNINILHVKITIKCKFYSSPYTQGYPSRMQNFFFQILLGKKSFWLRNLW